MLRTTVTAVLAILALAACEAGGDGPDGPRAGGDTAMAPVEGERSGMAGLPDADVRAILELDRSYQDAVQTGEWESLRRVYASDAVHMPPNHEPIRGLDAIIAYHRESTPAESRGTFETDTDVIHGDATIGYHRGTWKVGSGDGEAGGSYLWVLRRMPDGEWRVVSGMATMGGGAIGGG